MEKITNWMLYFMLSCLMLGFGLTAIGVGIMVLSESLK